MNPLFGSVKSRFRDQNRSKLSKADGNAANLINNVKVVDHKEEIVKVYNVLCLIALFMRVLIILRGLKMYKRFVEKIVDIAANWPERSRE